MDCEQSEHVQLCGSDGITYQSICHLKQAKCMQQKSINVVNNERCGKFIDYFICLLYLKPPSINENIKK